MSDKVPLIAATILLILLTIAIPPGRAGERVVRVGVYENRPLVFSDSTGFHGLAIDILRDTAKKEGWQLRFVANPWPRCLELLKKGEIDLQVAIADSPARRQFADFTTSSLIVNWGRLYSRKETEIASLLELEGKKIAVVKGDIHAQAFTSLMEKFDRRVVLIPFNSYERVFQAISNRTTDCGVVNRLVAMQNAGRYPIRETPMIFNPIHVRFATPRDQHPELLAALDRNLKALKADPRSLYYRSLNHWLGGTGAGAGTVPPWLINTLIVLGGLTMLGLVFILTLKQQVKSQTRELRESRRRYQTLFSQSTDAIYVSDMEGRIIDCNQEACRCLGYERDEIIGRHVSDLDPKADKEDHVTDLWPRLRDGSTVTIESEHLRKDGSRLPVEIHIGRIEVQGEAAIMGIARDITRRKQAEAERDQALRELDAQRERLAVTLRSIGDGVIATDEKGKIVLINRITEQLTGWSEREAVGRPVEEVFHIINEKTGKRCDNPVDRVLEQGIIVGLANHTALIARDGTQRSIADSGAPIRDRDSNIIGAVLVFRDVTLERRTEEELLKIRKLESIGVLAGGIAHDFNNILAAILGNINLASQYLKPGHQALPLLEEADKAAHRARRLTQQLLTFSKGGQPVKQPESLPELIRESADFVLHGTSIACEYRFDDGLWPALVDRGQIGQVIQNLVMNSRQAMPEGGLITIDAVNVTDRESEFFQGLQDEKYIKITIQDNGLGIPEKVIEKIFDPYFTTKQAGSGLGLAICHSIINKHDGYIQVQSRVGHGTTFTLYLPAVPDSETRERGDSEPERTFSGTILLMDDEEMVLNVARRMLSHLGFEVLTARDGEEAIQVFRDHLDRGRKVEAAILDLTIPGGLGGKDAVHELRRIGETTRIIAASGYSTDPIMAHYREYGFDGAIAKPFSLGELSRVINQALE